MELQKTEAGERKLHLEMVVDNILLLLIFLLILIFYGCNRTSTKDSSQNTVETIINDSIYRYEYFGNTKRLAKKTVFSNDSLKKGYVIEFNKKGQLKKFQELQDTIRSGRLVNYFDKGNEYIICNYRKDKLFGRYRKFYPSGLIEIETFYINDHLIGDFYEYEESGKLYGYAFFNTNQECIYKIIYNENGGDSIKEGNIPMWYATFKETFKVNENVIRKVYLGTLPKSKIKVFEKNNGDWDSLGAYPFQGVYTLQHVYETPGEKIAELKVIFTNLNDGKQREEILELPVLVVD